MVPEDTEAEAKLSAGLAPPPDASRAADAQWKIHATVNEWIRFADVKAGALLTANGAVTRAVLMSV